MKAFACLLRREFWENRGAFLTLPLGIGGFIVFVTLLIVTGAATTINKIDGEKFLLTKAVAEIQQLDAEKLDIIWTLNLFGTAAIFNAVLLFVVFFYMLGALYDDRRDRSILFWKSLPVSDSKTVLSKLIAGSLLAPALWVAAIALTHLALMLIVTVLLLSAGVPVYEYLWGPADPLEMWAFLFSAYVVQAFWMLPIWGWALLASAFARSKPFLWAVAPPVLLAILHGWFNLTKYFKIDFSLGTILLNRLIGGAVPSSINFDEDGVNVGTVTFSGDGVTETPLSWGGLLDRFATSDMWWGILFGALFITLAIYIRRHRDDS